MTGSKSDDIIYDKRSIERSIARGLISEADLKKHLGGLEDVEANGQLVPLDKYLGDEDPDQA